MVPTTLLAACLLALNGFSPTSAPLTLPLLAAGAFSVSDDQRPIQIEADAVRDFIVSLADLTETNHIKHLNSDEIKTIAAFFAEAKFAKRLYPWDTARMPYISRYEMSLNRGRKALKNWGTFFVVTIDGRTIYCEYGLFTLDATHAAQLIKILPSPKSPETKSERAEFKAEVE